MKNDVKSMRNNRKRTAITIITSRIQTKAKEKGTKKKRKNRNVDSWGGGKDKCPYQNKYWKEAAFI